MPVARRPRVARTRSGGVRRGTLCRAEDRSASPVEPSARTPIRASSLEAAWLIGASRRASDESADCSAATTMASRSTTRWLFAPDEAEESKPKLPPRLLR